MKSYNEIRKVCENTSRLSAKIVDEFLVGYVASRHGLEKEMIRQFDPYRHVTKEFEQSWVNMFMSQYLAHRVFRKGGMIGKLLDNPVLGIFTGEERRYLEQQASVPWRFSFSVILDEPEADFFLMEDIFSGEEYLLFSPSTSEFLAAGDPLLWFNLVRFNGMCWQSYGPIGAFNSFRSDDIFFFATELDPEIEDASDVAYNIEKNPVPYMMLFAGAAYPLTFQNDEEIRYMMAEHDLDSLDTAALRKSFQTEYSNGVYRFTPREQGDNAPLPEAYYDENQKLILFTAMTARRFREMVDGVNRFGYDFPVEPFLSVNTSMVATAKKILRKEVVLNEYQDLFHVDPDPVQKKVLGEMNDFITRVLPDMNAGRDPDIGAAIRATGIPVETAIDIMNMLNEKRGIVPAAGEIEGQKKAEHYSKIYSLMDAIRRMEPWKWMYETDVFGVKIPGKNQVYFISIMGAEGLFFALSAYKGHQGLAEFLHFHENAGKVPPETIFTIPHVMISFTDREQLGKEHLDSIRISGVKFRGKGNWPLLDEIVPGFIPAFPESETLKDLLTVLNQAVTVLSKARNDRGYLFRKGDPFDAILVRTRTGHSGKEAWEDRYETFDPERGGRGFHIDYSLESRAEVLRLPVRSLVLQADLLLLPVPVMEKGRKGFFPFALLLVDRENGVVYGMEMLEPLPDLHSLYESLPQVLLEEIAKLGFRPKKIEVRSSQLFVLLKKVLDEVNCTLEQVEKMPRMDEAVHSLLEHLQSNGTHH
jgi:hypothetical protein